MKKKLRIGTAVCIAAAAAAIGITACGSESASGNASETSAETAETESADGAATADDGQEEKNDASDRTQDEQSETKPESDIKGEHTVYPLPDTLNEDNIADSTFAAAFEPDDIKKDGENYSIALTVYCNELFDMVDMANLKSGDTIVISGEPVLIDTIENDNGYYVINGDIDEGGHYFRTDNDTVYYEVGYDDILTYHEVLKTVLPVDKDCIIYDSSDLDAGDRQFTLDDIINNENDFTHGFTENNTQVTVNGGIITEIRRSYLP